MVGIGALSPQKASYAVIYGGYTLFVWYVGVETNNVHRD